MPCAIVFVVVPETEVAGEVEKAKCTLRQISKAATAVI